MATEENLTGKEFAGCKVINKIGQGGMGTVYRAHHKALNKTVCVKILAKELANDKRNLEFFLREARSAAKLDHPNIVHVYNFGKENHNYFIVMSFIDGKSLQDMVVKDGPMPVEKATKFMCELLDGLAHAHSRGIIHRDIKPSNILVDKKGRSYLVDFGLARSVSEEKELTQAGEMIGTAYFMSPEQCLAKEVDNRADIYAVGALGFASMQMLQRYEGSNFTIRRLRRMMLISDVLFLVAAVLMFANKSNILGLSYITYIEYVYNKWVVVLLIAALLQLYSMHRIGSELEKEAKK